MQHTAPRIKKNVPRLTPTITPVDPDELVVVVLLVHNPELPKLYPELHVSHTSFKLHSSQLGSPPHTEYRHIPLCSVVPSAHVWQSLIPVQLKHSLSHTAHIFVPLAYCAAPHSLLHVHVNGFSNSDPVQLEQYPAVPVHVKHSLSQIPHVFSPSIMYYDDPHEEAHIDVAGLKYNSPLQLKQSLELSPLQV